jgi:hypothetical protein
MRAIQKTLFVSMLWIFVWCSSSASMAYDAELQALAVKLTGQMEDANLRSGTVLDFVDLQGTPNELGRFLAQELSNQLVSVRKKMSFVDRANLQTLLKENNLSEIGLVNPESSKKLGKMIGIDAIIFGTLTPLGDKFRLSVRAVSVETGTIISSQAATLPSVGGLTEMYTRGVAAVPELSASSSRTSAGPDARARMRGDSLKLSGREIIVVSGNYACNSFMGSYVDTCISAALVLENLSGVGFDAAIAWQSSSIGSCVFQYGRLSGLAVIDQNRTPEISKATQWQYVPVGAKVNFTVISGPCASALATAKTSDASISLAIKIGEQVFAVPVSASGIPIRTK